MSQKKMSRDCTLANSLRKRSHVYNVFQDSGLDMIADQLVAHCVYSQTYCLALEVVVCISSAASQQILQPSDSTALA